METYEIIRENTNITVKGKKVGKEFKADSESVEIQALLKAKYIRKVRSGKGTN